VDRDGGNRPPRERPMETPVFDLSLPKLLVLAVIALVVFGPNELPKMAAKAGKALRELRRIADGAKADLREGLGPEFAEFDINDLNPRHFVQKHLLSDLDGEMNGNNGSPAPAGAPRASALSPGEQPPYDTEAT
jgi:sec-independent protein translocase protein TatB